MTKKSCRKNCNKHNRKCDRGCYVGCNKCNPCRPFGIQYIPRPPIVIPN